MSHRAADEYEAMFARWNARRELERQQEASHVQELRASIGVKMAAIERRQRRRAILRFFWFFPLCIAITAGPYALCRPFIRPAHFAADVAILAIFGAAIGLFVCWVNFKRLL
jgi:hypothetical protein